MNSSIIPLSSFDIAVAAGLIILSGIISIIIHLRIEKSLFISSARTLIQLLLVGYILKWVFHIDNPIILLIIILIMVFIAAKTAISRSSKIIKGITSLSFFSLIISSFFTIFVITQLVIGVTPWYNPQYVIPLIGMILGNSLTGISICLDYLLDAFVSKRAEIEMELSLGATKWEAARDIIRDSIRKGMIPIINSMSVAGIVSVPGMMTGQILGGSDPLDAAKYQIITMFMVASATSFGCIIISFLVYKRCFNDEHQLLWNIEKKK